MSVPCAVLAICCVLRVGFAQSPLPSPVPPLETGPVETGLVQTGPDDWGQDHVGKAFPPYVTGDECLFCHRDIGPNWGSNPHQLTLRPALPDLPAMTALSVSQPQQAAETRFLLGSSTHTRFLKRSQKYGQLELSNLRLDPDSASQLRMAQDMTASEVHWQADKFGEACAGCHCTAVDTASRAFSALSIDCFACHGDVPLSHTDDVSQVWLSDKKREPRAVISICGQCHLRGGKSRSSQLPYANTFVAGDNLFRDFTLELQHNDADVPFADRHIYENVRDVIMEGNTTVTCLSCHRVHAADSSPHISLAPMSICGSCHQSALDPAELLQAWLVGANSNSHSKTCEY